MQAAAAFNQPTLGAGDSDLGGKVAFNVAPLCAGLIRLAVTGSGECLGMHDSTRSRDGMLS